MSEFDGVETALKEMADALKTAREKISGGAKDTTPAQGRLDIDDAERKNREANAKKSIQDLRDLREGKITNDELKERVKARGGLRGGSGMGGSGLELEGKMSKNIKPKMKAGGKVTASSRADGCAVRGKTKGRMV